MRYRDISVRIQVDDTRAMMCRVDQMSVKLSNYFMMAWPSPEHPTTSTNTHYEAVTAGSNKNSWFLMYKKNIKCAAMGKGAPNDYALALEWAVYSGRLKFPTQPKVQKYLDENMGIDCSGFATNYLIANGKRTDDFITRQDTSAASYFDLNHAVNDLLDIREGDLLVEMNGNHVETSPGHVMVVQSLTAASSGEYPNGSLQIVESTHARNSNPNLTESTYTIEKVVPKTEQKIDPKAPHASHHKAHHKADDVPCMILVVTRFGQKGFRASVMRY